MENNFNPYLELHESNDTEQMYNRMNENTNKRMRSRENENTSNKRQELDIVVKKYAEQMGKRLIYDVSNILNVTTISFYFDKYISSC